MKTFTTNIFQKTSIRIMDLKIGLLKVRGYAMLLFLLNVGLCLVCFCVLLGCFVLGMDG